MNGNSLGFAEGDRSVGRNEKAPLSVWLVDRDNLIAIDATGAVAPRVNGPGPLVTGDEFTIEVETQSGDVLRISRIVPDELTPILDMR